MHEKNENSQLHSDKQRHKYIVACVGSGFKQYKHTPHLKTLVLLLRSLGKLQRSRATLQEPPAPHREGTGTSPSLITHLGAFGSAGSSLYSSTGTGQFSLFSEGIAR